MWLRYEWWREDKIKDMKDKKRERVGGSEGNRSEVKGRKGKEREGSQSVSQPASQSVSQSNSQSGSKVKGREGKVRRFREDIYLEYVRFLSEAHTHSGSSWWDVFHDETEGPISRKESEWGEHGAVDALHAAHSAVAHSDQEAYYSSSYVAKEQYGFDDVIR
jgi:hypothetical protein